MSELVTFSCAGCRHDLQIDAAHYGHPVTCPNCSATQVVHAQLPPMRDNEVPMRLSLPRGFGFQMVVSRETANSSAKVIAGAVCTALGVAVAVLFGNWPRGGQRRA
jgi:hypothetical protein